MFQFGASNNTATQQQPGSSMLGGGATFGNKPATSLGGTTGGSLFGGASKPAFGNPTATTGSTATTGLFGNNAQPQNTLGTGGLFGNKSGTNAPGANGGLFGANTQQQGAAPTLGGGLFGANNNQQSQPQQSTSTLGGGLFGSNTTQNDQTQLGGTTTGGLFGQTQSNTAQQPTGFVMQSVQPSFAWSQQSQPQQQPQQFGQQSTLFPQSQQQPQTQAQPQQNSLFGSLNLQTPSSRTLQQQQQSANYPQQIQEQIIKCKESWDPTSYKSKLRTFVYNKVNEDLAMLYNKPATILQEEWDNAIKEKPSNSVIPVELLGFEALNQRNQLQIENVAQIRIILKQLLEKNTQLQQRHELEIASRILKVESKNVEIERRILKLGSQLAILKNRGLPLNITEEKMWNQFKELLNRSQDPSGLGKTNELWARLAVLKERARNISDQLDNTLVIISQTGGVNVPTNKNNKSNEAVHTLNRQDSEDIKNDINIDKIAHILSNQQQGITYLKSVLDKDQSTVEKL